jgi:NADPH:quinone reductase-like Zn-dependent oxidoreductase
MNDPSGDEPSARALWYMGPHKAEVRGCDNIAPAPEGHVRVRALAGAISRGTERLVWRGEVPRSEWDRMRAPHQAGAFPYPVKYGYAVVGTVIGGDPAWRGRTVFALHPHQTVFTLPREAVVPVPDGVPPERAVLAANMETALNGLWDAGAGPCDRFAVVGGGVVGLLAATLAAQLPGAEVTLIDVDASRAGLADRLGFGFAVPADAPEGCDLVLHASGRPAGLATALAAAGREATVVELSWYGETPVTVPLGGNFHSGRVKIVSSQVGAVAPSRRPRWSPRRRLEAAMALLADERLDALLSPPIPFETLPDRLEAIFAETSGAPCPRIRY